MPSSMYVPTYHRGWALRSAGIRLRADSLVACAAAMLVAVREEVVDDHSDDGEEEDEQTPQHLVCDWAAGLEHLDCCA